MDYSQEDQKFVCKKGLYLVQGSCQTPGTNEEYSE